VLLEIGWLLVSIPYGPWFIFTPGEADDDEDYQPDHNAGPHFPHRQVAFHLENVSTKDGILSRFSLSRKGCNAKFNISMDKELEEEASQGAAAAALSSNAGLWSSWKKDDGAEK
jgi:hypothetical protein